MSKLIEIKDQIAKLQKQAEEIRTKEFDKTVQEILDKMQAFGITVKDLQTATAQGRGKKGRAGKSGSPAKKAGKSHVLAGKPVPAKYRGPNGETWSGRGLMPKWLASLVAQGRTKEEFAVTPA